MGVVSGHAALPCPCQLAALGPLLCIYRAGDGSELQGWTSACRVATCDDGADGLSGDVLLFFDAGGYCCWALQLLPDTDFLAWERLAASLPSLPRTASSAGRDPASTGEGAGLRRWMVGAGRGRGWLALGLRLHALPLPARRAPLLAASLAALSPVGTRAAQRRASVAGARLAVSMGSSSVASRASSAWPVRFPRSAMTPSTAGAHR